MATNLQALANLMSRHDAKIGSRSKEVLIRAKQHAKAIGRLDKIIRQRKASAGVNTVVPGNLSDITASVLLASIQSSTMNLTSSLGLLEEREGATTEVSIAAARATLSAILGVKVDTPDSGILSTEGFKELIKPLTLQYFSQYVDQNLPQFLRAELRRAISPDVAARVGEDLPVLLGKSIRRLLVEALVQTLTYTVPTVILRRLPAYLAESLEYSLVKTLTRGLTHALSSSLSFTLSQSPRERSTCHSCASNPALPQCAKCMEKYDAKARDVASTQFYAAYYSDYYSDYYTGDPRPLPGAPGTAGVH